MTWSYDESEPTDRDVVRGLVGDTLSTATLLSNETLDAILAATPSVKAAAIEACTRIIAKLARDTDRSAVGLTSNRSQTVQHYRDLRQMLQRDSARAAEIFVGGHSTSANESLLEDSDYRGPTFRIGEDDHP